MENIESVLYTTVWNDGEYELSTNAQYDKATKEVFDIEEVEFEVELLDVLEFQFIELDNGDKLEVEETDGKYFAIN